MYRTFVSVVVALVCAFSAQSHGAAEESRVHMLVVGNPNTRIQPMTRIALHLNQTRGWRVTLPMHRNRYRTLAPGLARIFDMIDLGEWDHPEWVKRMETLSRSPVDGGLSGAIVSNPELMHEAIGEPILNTLREMIAEGNTPDIVFIDDMHLLVINELRELSIPFVSFNPVFCTDMHSPFELYGVEPLPGSVSLHPSKRSGVDEVKHVVIRTAVRTLTLLLRTSVWKSHISLLAPETGSVTEDLYSLGPHLYMMPKESIPFPERLPSNVVPLSHIRPFEKRSGLEKKWQNFANEGPFILFSLGTQVRPSKEVLNHMLNGLMSYLSENRDMRLIASVKDFNRRDIQHIVSLLADPRHKIADTIPQSLLLKHENAQVFLSHCGANSLREGLAAGVPMLCIPFYLDQHNVASFVDYSGAGVWLSRRALSTDIVRSNLRRLVNEPQFRVQAARMKNDVFVDGMSSAIEQFDLVLSGEYTRAHNPPQPLWWTWKLDILVFVFSLFALLVTSLHLVFTLCCRTRSSTRKEKHL